MIRSEMFLASAKDERKTRIERNAAWGCYEVEAWYEAVAHRHMPILTIPEQFHVQVRALMWERSEGPISGTQIRL